MKTPAFCPYGHPYTPENTYRHPRGTAHCRICMRDAQRENSRRERQLQRGIDGIIVRSTVCPHCSLPVYLVETPRRHYLSMMDADDPSIAHMGICSAVQQARAS